MAIRWTDEEADLLREAASSHTVTELATMFSKTTSAIYQACRKFDISPKRDKKGPRDPATVQIVTPVVLAKSDANGRAWAPEEDEQLRQWGPASTLIELAEMLDRTVKSVRHRCVHLGIRIKDGRGAEFHAKSGPRTYKPESGMKAWTEAELTLLRTLAPALSVREVAEKLGRTEKSVAWAVFEHKVSTRGRNRIYTKEELLAKSIVASEAQQRRHDGMWTAIEQAGKRQCSKCSEVRSLSEFYFDTKAQRPVAKCKWCMRAVVFGLMAQQLVFLFESHQCRCALCCEIETKESVTGLSCRLSVDHDHSCCARGCAQCIRGVLCQECNWMLGKAEGKPLVAARFADYLARRPLRGIVVDNCS